ncbi:hypothetical protein [Kitasatospora sp. NPDC015120]|uniref:hypothetical protein n=1 Tax=Kitasatospora sp. NPDC015120 TaxID=3364023 RepID=UPI0036F458A1
MAETVGEAAVRHLVAGWLAAEPAEHEDGRPGGGTPGGGWAVPPADGAVVIAAARRLAVDGLGRRGPRTVVPDGLRRIAEALVVDEHPSAARWTALERAQAVEWVALLLHRFGEDGVAMLTADLLRETGAESGAPDAAWGGAPTVASAGTESAAADREAEPGAPSAR